MFKISLTPKTPEQILLAAVNSNNQVHTYTPEFSASATIGAGAMTIGSLDLKIQDPIDVTPKQQMAFDIMADIGVNYACTLYQATGSVRKKDSVLFGKIGQVSDSIIDTYGSFSYSSSDLSLSTDEIKKNLQAVYTNWLEYDISGIDSEPRTMLDSRDGDQSIIDSVREKVQNLLSQKDVLPEETRLANEDISGYLLIIYS